METTHLAPKDTRSQQPSSGFDLDRMKKAVESPGHKMPDNLDFEGFDKWMSQLAKKSST
jgi:hypothetical protein